MLVDARGLVKRFGSGGLFGSKQELLALDGVDLAVRKGEVVGLVGESGSGKTTLGKTILRLYEPDEGTIAFDGVDITSLSERKLRPLRRRMQIVFQDPHSSLNPRMTVGEALHEPSAFHRVAAEGELEAYVGGLLDMVGLPGDARTKYPHELSGGQRQRVGIARALSVKPELVVLDEPVSALDVSIQAQVLNLLQDLRERLSLTYVLISHDLGVVRCFADRVLVMYLGRIVEEVPAASLSAAKHPYTEALLRAVPKLGGGRREAPLLDGEPPSPYGVRRGCVFADRCPKVEPACREQRPELVAIGEGHRVACPVVIAGR